MSFWEGLRTFCDIYIFLFMERRKTIIQILVDIRRNQKRKTTWYTFFIPKNTYGTVHKKYIWDKNIYYYYAVQYFYSVTYDNRIARSWNTLWIIYYILLFIIFNTVLVGRSAPLFFRSDIIDWSGKSVTLFFLLFI